MAQSIFQMEQRETSMSGGAASKEEEACDICRIVTVLTQVIGKLHPRVLLSPTFNSCKFQLTTPHMEAVQNHLTYFVCKYTYQFGYFIIKLPLTAD